MPQGVIQGQEAQGKGKTKPVLGTLPLAQVTNARLVSFLQTKSTHGRLDGRGGLSASTLQALSLILKSTLTYAAREGFIPPMELSLKCPESKREAVRTLSPKEQAALEGVLRTEMDAPKLGILLCLYTGLRIGEVCALRWENIDLTNGLLQVRHTVQRLQTETSLAKTAVCLGLPKSKCSLRSIPIPSGLAELLSSFRCQANAYLLTGQAERLMEPRDDRPIPARSRSV